MVYTLLCIIEGSGGSLGGSRVRALDPRPSTFLGLNYYQRESVHGCRLTTYLRVVYVPSRLNVVEFSKII